MIALSSLLLAAVRELDQTAFNEIEESPLPAFLKLDPPNCAACHLFSPFWASWAEAADNMGLEGRVWRVDCGVHQAVCKDRQVAHNGDEPNFASAPDASFVGFFDVWTGSVWRRYDGVKDAQTLANWLGSGAWQRDDGPHLTTPEQNWRDPWVQSFAKHAARSSPPNRSELIRWAMARGSHCSASARGAAAASRGSSSMSEVRTSRLRESRKAHAASRICCSLPPSNPSAGVADGADEESAAAAAAEGDVDAEIACNSSESTSSEPCAA